MPYLLRCVHPHQKKGIVHFPLISKAPLQRFPNFNLNFWKLSACGQIFCNDCSLVNFPLVPNGPNERLCNACFFKVSEISDDKKGSNVSMLISPAHFEEICFRLNDELIGYESILYSATGYQGKGREFILVLGRYNVLLFQWSTVLSLIVVFICKDEIDGCCASLYD